MGHEFSHRTRAHNLVRLGSGRFDVLVVGGGVVGAAVARDAATRGLRTALVERGDFASGTSGKTSRLIHGGLRYLRDLRIRLVRQASRERDRLIRVAPSIVRPLRFVIPVYEGRGLRPWSLRLGLLLYDRLSTGTALPPHRWLSPEDLLAMEPRLARRGLRGGGVYFDASADDARLVLAIVRDAATAGAVVANYAEATGLLRGAGRVTGARVRDRIGDASFEVRSEVVVNATGPWTDAVRDRGRVPALRPTKGIHVLLPRDRLGNVAALTLTAPRDRRILFVVPWGPLALVGTTDTEYSGDPDRVLPDGDDVGYLLESVNEAFPEARVGPEDIVSAYAGLRALVGKPGPPGRESDISRKHDVFADPDGLISVAGGKLTTQRAIAEETVDLACRRLGRRERSVTHDRPLGPPGNAAHAFRSLGFDAETAAHLAARHDPEEARAVVAEPGARERIDPDLAYLYLEVSLAVDAEMAVALSDVLVRRVPLFYEARDQGRIAAPAVAAWMGRRIGWGSDRIREEVRAYEELVADHGRFRAAGRGAGQKG